MAHMGSRDPRGTKAIVAALWALCFTLAAPGAQADPSVWARARDPRVTQQEELTREAQKAVLRYRALARAPGSHASSIAEMLLRDARRMLGRAVKEGANDFGIRLLYVEVLRESKSHDEALAVATKLLKDDPPAPIRADVLGEIAVLHAHAGRREEEIHAYSEALAIEPHALARSRLLANRAEALMALGDVTSAVEGYRAALAPLTSIELFWAGSTTLFGLGVALDRLGNLEEGLQSIRLARSYDATDRGLRKDSWFFSPEHDEHWYWALGAWVQARSSEGWAVRADAYERAIKHWEAYLAAAPADDRWLPLARVRLAACTRERDELSRAFLARQKAEARSRQPAPAREARP